MLDNKYAYLPLSDSYAVFYVGCRASNHIKVQIRHTDVAANLNDNRKFNMCMCLNVLLSEILINEI